MIEINGEQLMWECGTPAAREEEEAKLLSKTFRGGVKLDKYGDFLVYTVVRPEKKTPLKRLFSFL